MSQTCIARFAHKFERPCVGTVHSVFSRAVNVTFMSGEGTQLLTLVSSATSALPDSLCVPESLLRMLCIHDELTLYYDSLSVFGKTFFISDDEGWSGRVKPRSDKPDVVSFLRATCQLASGFDLLPQSLRERVDTSLQTSDFEAFLGLGFGLTPSFDDACIGAMAVSRVLGETAPQVVDLSMTTDISAHYLRLAMMGFFSQPLLEVINALFTPTRLIKSIQALQAFGATSGSDMIYGMRQKMLKLYCTISRSEQQC